MTESPETPLFGLNFIPSPISSPSPPLIPSALSSAKTPRTKHYDENFAKNIITPSPQSSSSSQLQKATSPLSSPPSKRSRLSFPQSFFSTSHSLTFSPPPTQLTKKVWVCTSSTTLRWRAFSDISSVHQHLLLRPPPTENNNNVNKNNPSCSESQYLTVISPVLPPISGPLLPASPLLSPLETSYPYLISSTQTHCYIVLSVDTVSYPTKHTVLDVVFDGGMSVMLIDQYNKNAEWKNSGVFITSVEIVIE